MKPGSCYICWKYWNEPIYRVHFDQIDRNWPCRFRGTYTGDKALCEPCQRKTGMPIHLKVFGCSRHGVCVPSGQIQGIQSCTDCLDWERGNDPFPAAPIRHLLYHIWPKARNIWQWNLNQLLKRIDLFNGRRIVGIVDGQGSDHPEVVQEYLGDAVTDYVILPNDRMRREVQTFEPLWSRLETQSGREAIFYAQAKGQQYAEGHQALWTETCYKTCLDYWPLVQRTLEAFPIAGPFKKVGTYFADLGSGSTWHFSGTFFWVRAKHIFARDWRHIDHNWYGMEAWPGLHFKPEEAGCLFHERTGTMDLYNHDYWRTTVLPEWGAWEQQHAGERTQA
jgi:hypothetical protein